MKKFKIDIGPRGWTYGVYVRRFGIFWQCVTYGDGLEAMKDRMEQLKELPIYG